MLMPKKTKHRKMQKGRSRKRTISTRGLEVNFGKWGLQALSAARIDSRQIEAARKSISHHTKRSGKVWIRIFPDKPITKKAAEVGMGKGKGAVDHYAVPVTAGRILFEISGVSEEIALRALNMAGHKLPVRTRIIEKH